MEEITVPCVTAVLKEAMRIDKDLHEVNAHTKKKFDVKLEMIKCGFSYAMKELENHPLLKAPYDHQVLLSASSSTGVTMGDTDARIKFGDMIIFLFENLTKALGREKSKKERCDLCELSVGQENLVNQALACLNKIAVLPYIPEGIGPRTMDKWWKSAEWKKIIEDTNYQAKQLHIYLTTVFELMDVSCQAKARVVNKELDIIMIAAEVLYHLGDTSLRVRYRTFLTNIDPFRVLDEASVLIRPTDAKNNWFNVSMSGIVTDMVGRGHLLTLFKVYRTRDHLFKEGNMTSCLPFLRNIALCLCRGRSATMHNYDYYGSVVDQFFTCITKPSTCNQEVVTVFNFFIDTMYKEQLYFAREFMFNRFFRPLEKLFYCEDRENLHHIPLTVRFLAILLADEKIQSEAVTRSPRFRKLIFLLITISSELEATIETQEEMNDKKTDMDNFRNDLRTCINAVFKSITRKELLLLWIAREPENLRRIEVKFYDKSVNRKIQVVGEDNDHVWQFPYGQVYVEAFKCESPIETTNLIKDIANFLIDLQSDDDRMAFGFASLFEVMKSHIHDIGYINRLSEHEKYEDPIKRNENFHLYAANLVCLADTLNDRIFKDIDDDPLASPLQKCCTLEKLLQLTILTTSSVVENVQRETERQNKEASLDVIRPIDAEEDDVTKRLRKLITATAAYGIKLAAFIPLMQVVQGEEMKKVENEVNEVIRLTALLKKSLGEMRNIPEEFEHLKDAFAADQNLNSVIAEMEGSVETNEANDSSYFNTEDILELLKGFVHEKGQALHTLGRLLKKRNSRLMNIYETTFHVIVVDLISHSDSYVYLAAINCAAEAALAMTTMITPFVHRFATVISERVKKNAQGEVVERQSIMERVCSRVRHAAVICKVFDLLGTASPMYASAAIHLVMPCVDDHDADIRASAYACMEHLFSAMVKQYNVDHLFKEVLGAVKDTLLVDSHAQVRRNAMHIIPMVVRHSGRDILENMSDVLLDMYRLINHVIHTDRDEVVLLHAQMAKEEIGHCINDKLKQELEENMRRIKI